MDALEFVAALVDALAWPAAAIVIALVFRHAITAALSGQIKRWKAGPGGLEVEYWEHTVADARQQLEHATPGAVTDEPAVLAEELTEVAQVAPGAAVLEAYVRVERELRRLVDDLPHDQLQRTSGRQLADLAHRHGRISDETLNALHGLTVLRNLAAHAHPDRDDLDTARAIDYLHLADAVLYALRNQPRGGRSAGQ